MCSRGMSKEEALLALMHRTKYLVVQENGQRKYGPPPDWIGPPPRKGSEVFIGKIPRDCYEDEIVPLFEQIGKVYELRLMMDFSGANRGYGFLMYTTPNDAKRAVKQLNNYEIRPGKTIGVVKSLDNCRLFVGKIPKDKTREEIIEAMSKVTQGVVNAIVHSYARDRTKNRGYAFVEYENHRAAAMARRKLLPGKIKLFDCDIQVDWADPEPEVDEETMSKVKILYVRNIRASATEEDMRRYFSLNGRFLLERVKKIKDYGFVHYSCREHAEEALQALRTQQELEDCELCQDGCKLEITWAKPVNSQTKCKKRTGRQRYPNISSSSTPAAVTPTYVAQNFNQYAYGFGDAPAYDFLIPTQSPTFSGLSQGLDASHLRMDATKMAYSWNGREVEKSEKPNQKSRVIVQSPPMYINETQYPHYSSSFLAHPYGDAPVYNQYPLMYQK